MTQEWAPLIQPCNYRSSASATPIQTAATGDRHIPVAHMHLDAHESKKRIERVSVRLRHAGPIQALKWLGISISTVRLGGLCEQLSSLWCVALFHELRRESCGLEEARRCTRLHTSPSRRLRRSCSASFHHLEAMKCESEAHRKRGYSCSV